MNRSVYVVDSTIGFVKIGIADNAEERLNNLLCATPLPMTLAFTATYERVAARQIEAQAHKLLNEKRGRGEWFNVSIEDAIAAVLAAAEELGYEIVKRPEPTIEPSNGLKWLTDRLENIRLPVDTLAATAGVRRETLYRLFRGTAKRGLLHENHTAIERALIAEEIRLRDYLIGLHGVPQGEGE